MRRSWRNDEREQPFIVGVCDAQWALVGASVARGVGDACVDLSTDVQSGVSCKVNDLSDQTPTRSSAMTAAVGAGSSEAGVRDRVQRVIDLIRPAVQADGGDIELVSVNPDSTVSIRLHGACVGCPSSSVTLQMGIERNLKTHVPEIKGVVAVE